MWSSRTGMLGWVNRFGTPKALALRRPSSSKAGTLME
jgi:hypothetical protein